MPRRGERYAVTNDSRRLIDCVSGVDQKKPQKPVMIAIGIGRIRLNGPVHGLKKARKHLRKNKKGPALKPRTVRTLFHLCTKAVMAPSDMHVLAAIQQ
jgi:hypothetical protein